MKSKTFLEWFSSSPKSFGVCLQPAETDKEGPLFRGQKAQLWIHGLCKSFVDKVHSAAADKKLTTEGKRDSVQRHAAQALAELKQGYKKYLDPCVQGFVSFDSTHLSALRSPANALEAIERMKILQLITGLAQKDRVELIEGALRDNDQAVLGTFFDKPGLYKLLDSGYIAQVRRKYMSEHAPQLAEAEQSAAVLTFDLEKIVDELSFFCPGPNENAVEIHKSLSEIGKLGLAFETNPDLRMMQSGAVPSRLPELGAEISP